jgi:class 3 adenylate cyclase
MSSNRFTSPLKHPWTRFVPVFLLTLAVFTLYGINIVKWRNSPDFGWRAMYESGPNVAADLFERAEAAGLRVGDNILAINGRAYSTFEALFFEIRDEKPGAFNVYTVKRGDQEVEISIANGRLGLERVLRRSGPLFFLGFVYFMIGVLVFLMKPRDRVSWLFLVQTSFFGAMICYQSPSDLLRPLWLFDVRNFIEVFMPAPMMHLALRFPKTRSFLIKQPRLVVAPYLLSLTLFIIMRIKSTAYWNIPPSLNHIYNLFIMLSVLTFLLSVIWNFLKDPSAAVKIQSQAILVGIFIGFFIPVIDLVIRSYLNVYLFPDPVIGFMVFLTAFPLSIGYTIVKHDLFAIDTVIKRTYGYLLTTGAVIGTYAMVVTTLNLVFGQYEISRSPAFIPVFGLAVVFFFNPVHKRIKRFVDRVFYRLEYDYKETVQKISETMRTLMSLNEIGRSIMNFALGSMFIDSGSVMLLNPDKNQYYFLIRSGEREDTPGKTDDNLDISEKMPATITGVEENEHDLSEAEGSGQEKSKLNLPSDDPLIQKIAARKKEVTMYDIQNDPFFEAEKDVYEKAFNQLGATLVVPLIYEDQLSGLIALGRKKSGKFYCGEDVNLLNIIANQGAVAIKNAAMLEEIIEKERLKIKIMDSFGKYVTREVRDHILEGRIPLDGETKDVTVLFADLRGFTTLAESTTPKEVVKIINGYFSEMAEAIGQNHGLVLQFAGDEIEAVFGAPLPLENHPTHAVRAAIAMRKRLVSVNEKLQQKGYDPLRHGIGLHTGNVVAANIGSDDRLSYALVGDTVNVASRIQGLNKEYGTDILVSATTVERLANKMNFEKLPAKVVKGKKKPVKIFKLNQYYHN